MNTVTNYSWMKRSLSFFLAIVMVFMLLPPAISAKKPVLGTYGDVNGDGAIDVKDALLLQKSILGVSTEGFDAKYADVNGDGVVDLKDLLNVKKFLAEWKIELGPGMVTVSFYDGERLVDQLQTLKGEILGCVPANELTSRSDAIFLGWYTDPEFKTPYYPDLPVSQDMSVYGKYAKFSNSTLTVTSFAQTDLKPDATFTVVGSGDLSAILLTPMDGSDPLQLSVTGEGPYTVSATEGFREGSSYELTLPEGLNFVGSSGETLPETIRTASFTIAKEASDRIQMKDSVHFVKHEAPSELKAADQITLSGIQEGDLICFYHTTSPEDRDYKTGNAYTDDPEIWFKAADVNGDTVTLAVLEDTDSGSMFEIPDNFPVMGALPDEEGGTLTLESDEDGYALDKLIIKTEDGTTIEYTDKDIVESEDGKTEIIREEGVYYFNRPSEKATVHAVFKVDDTLLGDIDLNDAVDIADAMALFRYSMMPDLYPIAYSGAVDFTSDGVIDIADAIRLFQYSMLPDLYPLF
ncbi:MAG: hypothetical protein IKT91_02895 [Clostridia bacterium]|nr:hypothetical protein [Clostridia bacterium]